MTLTRECGVCQELSTIHDVTCTGCGRLLVMTVPDRVLAKDSGTGAAARRINNIARRAA